MSYVGYCVKANKYVFALDNNTTIEVDAKSLPQAIERARQYYFGF
jgi:hypothetical protein